MDNEPERVALIDMDGSVADYDLAMRGALTLLRSPEEPELPVFDKSPWMEERKRAIKKVPGFWRSLPRIEAGFRVVSLLQEIGFNLNVLTKGPYNTTSAWTEKVDWCREHLPGVPVTITEDKGLTYGRVLFDDYPPYINRWLTWRPRGIVVMLDTEWNQSFSCANMYRVRASHLEGDLVSIRPILEAAYVR